MVWNEHQFGTLGEDSAVKDRETTGHDSTNRWYKLRDMMCNETMRIENCSTAYHPSTIL